MNEITAYTCSYCGRVYKIKSSAVRHEKRCFANPEQKACRTCKHVVKGKEVIHDVSEDGEKTEYDVSYLYCEVTGALLRHPEKFSKFENRCAKYQQGPKLF